MRECKRLHDPKNGGRIDLYESCLLFNNNPTKPLNFLANLCFTEQMT